MPGSWIWFPILWVCKEKQSCQVRVADPAASVRNVEVAPHARKRFAFLVCLWGSFEGRKKCCR